MSLINVDKIDPQSGTALEVGTSGDTVTVPSGVGLTLTDSTLLLPTTIKTDKLDPKSGTALEIGTSGDTITVPTGAGLTVTDEVKTNKISPATGTAFALGDSGDTFTVPSGATIVNSGTATGFGGGKIGQVFNVAFTATQDIDTQTWTDVTSLTQAITPVATSSKILCMYTINISAGDDGMSRLMRDSTPIGIGDAAGSRARASVEGVNRSVYESTCQAFCFLDEPSSTSEITYKVQAQATTCQINYSQSDSDGFTYGRAASTLTLMEVLA